MISRSYGAANSSAVSTGLVSTSVTVLVWTSAPLRRSYCSILNATWRPSRQLISSPRLVIIRIWHGRTARNRADEYAAFLERRAIPDYRGIAGNLDVAILRRDEREVTHFLTVTRWISEEAIRAFAGTEVLKAKYYPEDERFLMEFEPAVQHFTMVAGSP